MTFLTRRFTIAFMLLLPVALVMPACAVSGGLALPAQTAMTPTPAAPPQEGGGSDWVLLDNVPPGSPQIEYGREIYRLACSACHAYDGGGLSTEWRMTWAPPDQNCWQSKCHGLNHPSDGFFLPYSPPVTNLIHNGRFFTALELQSYIRQYMPWQDPASLLDERAWQVTAYVLKLNNIDPGPELNAETARKIRLVRGRAGSDPEGIAVSADKLPAPAGVEDPAPDSVERPTSNATLLPFVAALAVILLLVGSMFWLRRARR
jgi:hypothetical protein